MDSFRVLLRSAAFTLLLIQCSATHEEHFTGQRDVTFDLQENLQDMQQQESFMLQKEMDWSDLHDHMEFSVLQEMQTHNPDLLKDPSGQAPPLFVPRAFAHPRFTDYPVQFPPGRPNATNLEAICLNRDRRPLYPKSYFPASGFGQLKRRGHAINTIESWFGVCCRGNQTWEKEVTLCCATQVWELGLDDFCEEDASVKDRLYHCCRKKGSDRRNCFQADAPNPNYEATEALPVPPLPSEKNFSFDPSTCQRTDSTPESVEGKMQKKPFPSFAKNVDINFPPGRPTAADIDSLCLYRKLRPHYDLKCLPRKGYGWLARQSKSVNRVEKGFKQCCKRKQDVFTCADGKWREEIDRFCNEDKGAKATFPCCEKAQGRERYDCFQARAPQPRYDVAPLAGPDASAQEHSLNQVCSTHRIIKQKVPAGFPLQALVKQCCPLASEQQSSCIREKLEQMSQRLCSARRPPYHRCCVMSSQAAPECFSKSLMDVVTKATNAQRQKKKKCPLS